MRTFLIATLSALVLVAMIPNASANCAKVTAPDAEDCSGGDTAVVTGECGMVVGVCVQGVPSWCKGVYVGPCGSGGRV